jgi:DNA-binding NarL/FixJ family response regulator
MRVFLTCRDVDYCETLRESFAADVDFEVCGAEQNGLEAIQKAIRVKPHLIILEIDSGARTDFDLVDAAKLYLPEVPLFLVSDQQNIDAEKEAFAHGARALFKKEADLTPLQLNARETVGLA